MLKIYEVVEWVLDSWVSIEERNEYWDFGSGNDKKTALKKMSPMCLVL